MTRGSNVTNRKTIKISKTKIKIFLSIFTFLIAIQLVTYHIVPDFDVKTKKLSKVVEKEGADFIRRRENSRKLNIRCYKFCRDNPPQNDAKIENGDNPNDVIHQSLERIQCGCSEDTYIGRTYVPSLNKLHNADWAGSVSRSNSFADFYVSEITFKPFIGNDYTFVYKDESFSWQDKISKKSWTYGHKLIFYTKCLFFNAHYSFLFSIILFSMYLFVKYMRFKFKLKLE
tara:strand:- start:278 stop:964 length:687 start_codon:yes stop_codon:yes gene_type:complete